MGRRSKSHPTYESVKMHVTFKLAIVLGDPQPVEVDVESGSESGGSPPLSPTPLTWHTKDKFALKQFLKSGMFYDRLVDVLTLGREQDLNVMFLRFQQVKRKVEVTKKGLMMKWTFYLQVPAAWTKKQVQKQFRTALKHQYVSEPWFYREKPFQVERYFTQLEVSLLEGIHTKPILVN